MKAFWILFTLVVLRGWHRLEYSDIWAEDGVIFLGQALESGWGSLWHSYAGSFHIIPRLIVLLGLEVFPLSWMAWVLCLSYYFIFSYVVSTFTRSSYAWLIPSYGARCLLAGSICFAPGSTEMWGNLSNLNWVLFLYLASLGLKDPNDRITLPELLLTLFILASIGTGIFLVPLFGWRVYEGYRIRLDRSRQRGNVLVLLFLVSQPALLLFVKQMHSSLPSASVKVMGATLISTFLRSFVFVPWLGDALAIRSQMPDVKFWEGTVRVLFLAFVFIWVARNLRKPWAQAISLFVLGVSSWPLLNWIARPNTLWAFQAFDSWFLNHRYSFPMGAAAILFWFTCFRCRSLNFNFKSGLVLLFMTLGLVGAKDRFLVRAYGRDRFWKDARHVLETAHRTGCPNTVYVRTYPVDPQWGFTYQSKVLCHG